MNNIAWTLELRFLVALGLGILVGLERESAGAQRKHRVFAGVRTYALVTLFGFACGWLGLLQTPWALPAGMVAVTALLTVAYLPKMREGHVGWTSEAAVLLSFATGALAVQAEIWIPMALGLVSTFLLSEKTAIEGKMELLDQNEFLAVLKFLLVTLIVLPALPDRGYTKFDINPSRIWLIVVLVSSVGFAGYFLTKKFGGKVGMWLSGVLGGIVSSTAVSVAAGRIAGSHPERAPAALQSAILASCVMYLRILALVYFISPVFALSLAWRLPLLSLVGIALALSVPHRANTGHAPSVSGLQNPFELKPALLFALLFVGLSVATRLVREEFGNAGLLSLAFIVGAVDIDPFILSLPKAGLSGTGLAVAATLFAMMSNTVAKGFYFSAQAGSLRRPALIRYGLWAATHIPLALIAL